MTQDELNKVLEQHKLWLKDSTKGQCAHLRGADLQYAHLRGVNLQYADLQGAYLQGADLQYADLQYAHLRGVNLQYADLQGAHLRGVNLQYADLQYAHLQGADLQYADLQGAHLDFSCFPLWCGGTRFKADDRLVAQVLAHLCSLEVSDKAREELNKVLKFAKTSHRAKECGLIKEST